MNIHYNRLVLKQLVFMCLHKIVFENAGGLSLLQ